MRKFILNVLTIVCAFGPATVRSESILDVAVVFSSDTSLSVSEKLLLTAQIQAEVSLVAFNSQINRTIKLTPMVTTVPYDASDKPSYEANLWLKEENANAISLVYFARNFLNPGGADLILMVVDHWPDTPCGTAAQSVGFDPQNPLPPLLVSAAESEEFAFAAYAINASSSCRREITVAHEIGHLLYAEHEILGGVDNNNDIGLPSYKNHGITLSNGENSVMRGSSDSQTLPVFSGIASLSGVNAQVNAFIVDESWNTVSAYRPLPPQTANCTLIFARMCGLPKHITQAFVTATPMLTGHTVLDMDIDYKIGVSGSWHDMYSGPQSCPAIGLDLNSTVSFQALVNTTVGFSVCSAVVSPILLSPGYCEPTGGGGGGGGTF